MANSMYFKSTDLSGSSYGLTVTKSTWPELSTPSLDIQKVAFGPAVSYRSQFEPRVFDVNCLVQGTSRTDLHDKLAAIAGLLMDDDEQYLSFDAFRPTHQWKARYSSGLEDMEYMGLTAASFKLKFVCPDPIAYSTTSRTTPDISIDADPKTFNLESATAIPGNWYAKPIYIVKAVNGSNTVILSNTTTGETLTWASTMDNGIWLKVDCELFLVSLSGDSGASWTASMSYVSGSFPRLKPGVQNAFSIEGVNSGGTLSISYSGRFL